MIRIYGIKRLDDHRIRYVGQTRKAIATRLTEHVAAAKAGVTLPLMCWLRKHDDYEVVELDVIESETGDPGSDRILANEREIELITYYRSLGQADLNVTSGGWNPRPAGWKHSQETRDRISQNASMRNPEIAQRSATSRRGRARSEQAIKNVKAGLTKPGMHEKLSQSAKRGWEKRRKK